MNGAPGANDFAALRPLLAPLRFDSNEPLPVAFGEYAHFYGIDFERRMRVVHRAGVLEIDGFSLTVQSIAPEHPRGTVFVVHGYFDHVGIYRHPIEWFLERNYAVVAYDQPGHGLSSGTRASIDHFSRYIDALAGVLEAARGHCAEPWHLFAQSMGGAIAMTWLLQSAHRPPAPSFSQVVLLAPLVYPVGWSWGKWLHLALHRIVKSRPRTFVDNSHDRSFIEFVTKGDPLQPRELPLAWVGALKEWIREFEASAPCAAAPVIVQGTDDETVDWPVNIERIAEKFPAATIHYVTDARHHLVNESAELRGKIFELLERRF